MKRSIRARFVGTITGSIVAIVLIGGAGSPAKNESQRVLPSLCDAGETPLFQCPIGQKQLAICAAKTSSVQYRFGTKKSLELSYPSDPKAGPGTLRWAETGFSGGGEMQIQFENDGAKYVVYSRMVRTGFGSDGLHNPKDYLGVAVFRAGRLVSNRNCGGARIEGGHYDWIDEQSTKRLLPEGEYQPTGD
jgi:hypothetical protein